MPRISRRAIGKLLLTAPALPAAAVAAAQSSGPPKPSRFASCIAASESSLSAQERARLAKALGSLERSLKAIRELGNLCGLPGIAVPCGFGKDKLPASLSIVGAAFDEASVLALARAYQGITDWHRRRPPLTGPT